jgi:hypothetical protein
VPGEVTTEDVVPVLGVLATGAVVLVAGAPPDAVPSVVGGTVVEPEFPASLTRAAASTPSESTATITTATIGAFQFEDAARRVRAAAPQRRHHSCSGSSGAPQSGQGSTAEAGVVTPPPVESVGGGAATLTRPPAGDGGSQWVPLRPSPRMAPARARPQDRSRIDRRAQRPAWGLEPVPDRGRVPE